MVTRPGDKIGEERITFQQRSRTKARIDSRQIDSLERFAQFDISLVQGMQKSLPKPSGLFTLICRE
jgi:hypothetical protein